MQQPRPSGSAGTFIGLFLVLALIAGAFVYFNDRSAQQENAARSSEQRAQDRADFERRMEAAHQKTLEEQAEYCRTSRRDSKCLMCSGKGVIFGSDQVAFKCHCCNGTGSH